MRSMATSRPELCAFSSTVRYTHPYHWPQLGIWLTRSARFDLGTTSSKSPSRFMALHRVFSGGPFPKINHRHRIYFAPQRRAGVVEPRRGAVEIGRCLDRLRSSESVGRDARAVGFWTVSLETTSWALRSLACGSPAGDGADASPDREEEPVMLRDGTVRALLDCVSPKNRFRSNGSRRLSM